MVSVWLHSLTPRNLPARAGLCLGLAAAGLLSACRAPSPEVRPLPALNEIDEAVIMDAVPLVVVGTVLLVSNVPDPVTVPYKECLTFVYYQIDEVRKGDLAQTELIAVFWGMRDRRLLPASRFRVGQRYVLYAEPFSNREELTTVMQADDTEAFDLEPQWILHGTL